MLLGEDGTVQAVGVQGRLSGERWTVVVHPVAPKGLRDVAEQTNSKRGDILFPQLLLARLCRCCSTRNMFGETHVNDGCRSGGPRQSPQLLTGAPWRQPLAKTVKLLCALCGLHGPLAVLATRFTHLMITK